MNIEIKGAGRAVGIMRIIISVLVCIIFGWAWVCCLFDIRFPDGKQTEYEPYVNHVSWYEAKVKIEYASGSVDTVDIDVYENLDHIKVSNGNLTYSKATKQTGGTVSYGVQLASYVRSFKVLSSELKTKP